MDDGTNEIWNRETNEVWNDGTNEVRLNEGMN